jgi:hypothetical protein
MRRTLKFVHTVATTGLIGAFLLQLILSWQGIGTQPEMADRVSALGARLVLLDVVRWVLIPSVALVVLTGLWSMAATKAYSSAGWAWLKALLGLVLLKAVLLINHSAARDIVELLQQAGAPDAQTTWELARLARMEWLGTWVALGVSVAAIALGIWRPRVKPLQISKSTAVPVDEHDDTGAQSRPIPALTTPQPPATGH